MEKRRAVFSERIDGLAAFLGKDLASGPLDPLSPPLLLVPNSTMKKWLSSWLAFSLPEQVLFGLPVLTLEEWRLGKLSFFQKASKMFSLLGEREEDAVRGYLERASRKDLAVSLTELFLEYRKWGSVEGEKWGWQGLCYQAIFPKEGAGAAPQRIYGIGFSHLTPGDWDALLKSPELFLYLFSPCVHFWTDVCSDREKRRKAEFFRARGASESRIEELLGYLEEPPALLRNWGGGAREMALALEEKEIEILEGYTGRDSRIGRWQGGASDFSTGASGSAPEHGASEVEEFEAKPTPLEPILESRAVYTACESRGSAGAIGFSPFPLLQRLQHALLHMESSWEDAESDASIRLFSSGACRLREVEEIGEEILRLAEEEKIPFSQMGILASDLDAYAPFIELVFTQKKIPYTLHCVEIGGSSLYLQAVRTLLYFLSPQGGIEEIKTLFSNPCFYEKHEWDLGERRLFSSWLERSEEDLLDAWIFLSPNEKDPLEIGQKEALASFFAVREALFQAKEAVKEKALGVWAADLEALFRAMLLPKEEEEKSAFSRVEQILSDMRAYPEETPFPLSWVSLFFSRPVFGSKNGHQLHGVMAAPFGEGAFFPARALFWIGMEEESFPRAEVESSLNLLRPLLPPPSAKARSLLLQALFSVKEFLSISYRSFSQEEGKPLSLCPLVEELFSFLERETQGKISRISLERRLLPPPPAVKKARSLFPSLQREEAREKKTFSIADVKRSVRDPWRFYLEKGEGLKSLGEEPENESFFLTRARLLKASFQASFKEALLQEKIEPGLFQKALSLEVEETADAWRERRESWGLSLAKIALLKTCREKRFDPLARAVYHPSLSFSSEEGEISLAGSIECVALQGYVYFGKDDFLAMMRAWPELLASCAALGSKKVFCLQAGEEKELSCSPLEALQGLLAYTAHAEKALFPLPPEWIEPFLEKKWETLFKKREALEQGKGRDSTQDWVLERYELPSWESIEETWGESIEAAFRPLYTAYRSFWRQKDAPV